MVVDIGGYEIEVIIEYKRNKNLYIRVKEDLKFHVTCNRFVSKKEILDVINKNSKSLLKMYERQLKVNESNNFYYFLGDTYMVVFDDMVKNYKIDDSTILVRNQKMLDKFYSDMCKDVFLKRIKACENLFDSVPKYSLRIRKMSTRWGVNNLSSKTITLNSELIKKDVSLIDYVCIHELCHFLEANHSVRFWDEVKKRYPYYKEARKRLSEV